MLLPHVPLHLMLAVCLSIQAPASSPQTECQDWQECRQQALDAAARHEYERFHDLAWRTVQKGPPRSSELMFLLARAQSLSGRPHDALVMLDRLAAAGFMTTAATSPDFERVRSLPEWAGIRSQLALAWVRIDQLPTASGHPQSRSRGTGLPSSTFGHRVAVSTAPAAPVAPPAPVAPDALGVPVSNAPPIPPPLSVEEVLRLPSGAMTPAGLAHDGVSGRYVLADRTHRKLVIVDERAHHLVDLVDAASAGFNDITALVIDARRGDLWVVSGSEADGEHAAASVLHRVQLISGRPLASWPLPKSFGPARFADVDVGDGDTVFVLDEIGRRIFPVSPRTGRFGTPLRVPFEGRYQSRHRRQSRRLRRACRRHRARQPDRRAGRRRPFGARRRAQGLRARSLGQRPARRHTEADGRIAYAGTPAPHGGGYARHCRRHHRDAIANRRSDDGCNLR